MDMALNLLSFLVKHCQNAVVLDNALIAAFIRCCTVNGNGKMAMTFYEDMFLFNGDDHGVKSVSKSKATASKSPKWDLSALNQMERSSKPNVLIFRYLLDSDGNKKGIYSENV